MGGVLPLLPPQSRGTYSMMSSMVWLMMRLTFSVSSSAIPCSPMLNDASLVLPSYLNDILTRSANSSRQTETGAASARRRAVAVQLRTHPTTEEKSVPMLGSMSAL